ncbi:MAG: DUF1697 domain-containing protein [Maritimibacter sp.]
MNRWVLLLRGVNVGGHGKLPMADLKALMQTLGLGNIQTYIQSGNAVFTGIIDAAALETLLEDEIELRFGFRPKALLLSSENFIEIVEGFLFAEAQEAPKTGHVWVLSAPPVEEAEERLNALAANGEQIALTEHALYLHAPEGIGRSKLAAGAENMLGVAATARNLNTLGKLNEMLDALPRV